MIKKHYGPYCEADLIDSDIERDVAWNNSKFCVWKYNPTKLYPSLESKLNLELYLLAEDAISKLPEYKKYDELELLDDHDGNGLKLRNTTFLLENGKELGKHEKEFVESGRYQECLKAKENFEKAKEKNKEYQRSKYYRDKWRIAE